MNVKISQKKYDLEAEKVIEREVKPFGKSSAHVILPKKCVGQSVIIVILEKVSQWNEGYLKLAKKEGWKKDKF